jgi:hypothetical protein
MTYQSNQLLKLCCFMVSSCLITLNLDRRVMVYRYGQIAREAAGSAKVVVVGRKQMMGGV